MHIQKHLTALLLTVLVIGATFGAAAAQRPIKEPGPLFVPADQPALAGGTSDLGVTRSRSVTIDESALQSARPGKTVQLNLFEDVNLDAVISSVVSKDGVITWTGQIAEDPLAQVVLVSSEGQIAADVSMPGALFQVRYSQAEIYIVQEIDQSAYPEELPPIEVGAELLSAAELHTNLELEAPQDMDDSGTIDVLVLYTPQARLTGGGHTAMRNLINLAVAETNQSYANSGIAQRLRLVAAEEISYTESSSLGTDLANLQSSSDDSINQVHTLRNTYRADLVSLIVESSQYCGIAYLMNSNSSYFEEYAFSVVARSCATGYYSFAHELGHNMGARHDWYVDSGVTPNTYGHGYVSVEGHWRSIMAYDSECSAKGVYCSRLQYWSNPNIRIGEQAMGVPAGTNSSCRAYDPNHPPCDADDHSTLNETAYTIANFRQSASGSAPTPTPRPLTSYPHVNYLPLVRR